MQKFKDGKKSCLLCTYKYRYIELDKNVDLSIKKNAQNTCVIRNWKKENICISFFGHFGPIGPQPALAKVNLAAESDPNDFSTLPPMTFERSIGPTIFAYVSCDEFLLRLRLYWSQSDINFEAIFQSHCQKTIYGKRQLIFVTSYTI